MIITWLTWTLPQLSHLLDDQPAPGTLTLLAAANVVLWVGVFLLLLWLLMRGASRIDAQISKLEAKTAKDEEQRGM